MSQGGAISGSGGGGGGIMDIAGDSGLASGSTVKIFAGGLSGGTVDFVAGAAQVNFHVTDGNSNTCVGNASGNNSISGIENSCFGVESGPSLTSGTLNVLIGSFSGATLNTGSSNTMLGDAAGATVVSGSSNVLVGTNAGLSYTGAESSNVIVSNSGVLGESNVIRVGTQGSGAGQQNTAFFAGIVGNTVSNPEFVTINSATGQLGVSGSSSSFALNVQTFTTTGTYTPTANMAYCTIECVGGGGGGGGADTTTFSVGSGGGEGEYAFGFFSAAAIGASKPVTIGIGGVGNSAASGSNGGNTSVGALISANGGTGGVVLSTGSNAYLTSAGGAGGTGGAGGSVRFNGAAGGFATIYTPLGVSQYVLPGQGYPGRFTGGSVPPTVADGAVVQATNGNAATGHGGGGSGAIDYVNGTDQTGGAGSAGLVVVTEYIFV